MKNIENKKVIESKKGTPEGEKPIALVDIDETISYYPGVRSYEFAEPIKENIAKINKLHDEGWSIVYWTARGSSQKSKELGLCYYDFTWKQLLSWGCKFSDLSTGTKGKYMKPPLGLIVDDLSKRIEEL